MSLGRKSKTGDYKLVVLRIKNKTVDKVTGKEIPLMPHLFEVSEKNAEGKWIKRDQLEKSVSGDLTKIDFDSDEFEGKPYKIVKAYLSVPENKESFLLDLRYTGDTRNIFNAFLALESGKNLNISLYKKTGKDKSGQEKDYSNVAVRQNDELVKGKFTFDEIPKPEEVKNSKGVVLQRDFEAVDDFFLEHLKEWAKIINKKPESQKPSEEESPSTEELPPEDPKDERVPF